MLNTIDSAISPDKAQIYKLSYLLMIAVVVTRRIRASLSAQKRKRTRGYLNLIRGLCHLGERSRHELLFTRLSGLGEVTLLFGFWTALVGTRWDPSNPHVSRLYVDSYLYELQYDLNDSQPRTSNSPWSPFTTHLQTSTGDASDDCSNALAVQTFRENENDATHQAAH